MADNVVTLERSKAIHTHGHGFTKLLRRHNLQLRDADIPSHFRNVYAACGSWKSFPGVQELSIEDPTREKLQYCVSQRQLENTRYNHLRVRAAVHATLQ